MTSNFLNACLAFNRCHANSKTYTTDMINAYNWCLSQADDAHHIIGCRLALYNFHKYPSHRIGFWKLYLYHKNEFFRVFTDNH